MMNSSMQKELFLMSYLDSGNMTSDNSQGAMTNENLEAFDLQLNKPHIQYSNYSNFQLKNWIKE
jgi:hypothetical protein